MAANNWIKLYHEILNDYKMATLPDAVWRRCIELFLLAGDCNQAGALPPIEEIAFRLRVDVEQLTNEMEQLEKVGILRRWAVEAGEWYVAKFAERQAPVSDADRKRRQRERDRKKKYNGHDDVTESVTIRVTDTDTDTDKKQIQKRTDTDVSSSPVFKAYEQEIGILTPKIRDEIVDTLEDCPVEWILEAIGLAARANKRSWAYIHAILERWKVDGFQVDSRKGKQAKPGGMSELDELIAAEGVVL